MTNETREQGFALLDEAVRTGDGEPFYAWIKSHVAIDMTEARRIFGMCIDQKHGDRAQRLLDATIPVGYSRGADIARAGVRFVIGASVILTFVLLLAFLVNWAFL